MKLKVFPKLIQMGQRRDPSAVPTTAPLTFLCPRASPTPGPPPPASLCTSGLQCTKLPDLWSRSAAAPQGASGLPGTCQPRPGAQSSSSRGDGHAIVSPYPTQVDCIVTGNAFSYPFTALHITA